MNLDNRDFRKIGLWQTAFLGDAVLTLPFIHALKDEPPAGPSPAPETEVEKPDTSPADPAPEEFK